MTTSRLFGRANQARSANVSSTRIVSGGVGGDEEVPPMSNMISSTKSGRRVIGLQSGGSLRMAHRMTSDERPSGRTVMRASIKSSQTQAGRFSSSWHARTIDRSLQRSITEPPAARVVSPYRPPLSADAEGSWKHDMFKGAVKIGSTVFIRHLPSVLVGRNPSDGLEQNLIRHFSVVGPVIGVKIERSSMPAAHVYFTRSQDAARAVEMLNGKALNSYGGNIVLNFKEKITANSSTEKQHEYSEGNFLGPPRVTRTRGSVADDDAWMCDSRNKGSVLTFAD
eukprot:GHVH01007411.1.p1 GENE.GHVH01007411.1~~GHVH01007411.1.p1  ORF type:complete len:281 (+),score=24.57 GHVH01007411.1:183-1025(+)